MSVLGSQILACRICTDHRRGIDGDYTLFRA